MKIMCFDPGGTTGVVVLDTDHPTRFRGYQLGPGEHHIALWTVLTANAPKKVVCESFDYRVATTDGDWSHSDHRGTVDRAVPGINLMSRNYIGVIELYCQMRHIELTMQKPSEAVSKNQGNMFFNNDKLKSLGVYVADAPHYNDAMRHMLVYLVFKLKQKAYLKMLRANRQLHLTYS